MKRLSTIMAEQALFSRAVGFHLPSAIPVQLERVDQFAVGKVCCKLTIQLAIPVDVLLLQSFCCSYIEPAVSVKCGGSTYLQVLIYHKKPRTLFPWRKHELNFTSYSLPDLLVKDSNLKFATASNFLFDIGKGVETVDTKLGNLVVYKGNPGIFWQDMEEGNRLDAILCTKLH